MMRLLSLIVKIVIFVVLVLFATLNTHSVRFGYFPGQSVEWPLIVVLLIFFVVGTVFGILSMFGRLMRLRSENARLRREVEKNARIAREDLAVPEVVPTAKPKVEPVAVVKLPAQHS